MDDNSVTAPVGGVFFIKKFISQDRLCIVYLSVDLSQYLGMPLTKIVLRVSCNEAGWWMIIVLQPQWVVAAVVAAISY